jgi:hypothetical protein
MLCLRMCEQDAPEKRNFVGLVWAKMTRAKERRKSGAPFTDNKRFHSQYT